MKKAFLLSVTLFTVLKGFSQADPGAVVSYSGHYYAAKYDNVANQALKSEKLLDDQKAIDSLGIMRYDRFVNRLTYDSSMRQVAMLLDRQNMHGAAAAQDLQDYYTLLSGINSIIRSNDNYRHYMYMLNCKILMAAYESWSPDQRIFNTQKAITDATNFIRDHQVNDAALFSRYHAIVKDNSRLGTSKYLIVLDPKLMKDIPLDKLEMYVTDRNHYNIAKVRYPLNDNKQGVVKDMGARQRENGFLVDYLNSIRSIEGEPWFFYMNMGQQMHAKSNMLEATLDNIADWYIFFFYKGDLYYYSAMPKCTNESCEIDIPYTKM